eukprot:5019319-Prymnesium_polylepis.2
MAGLIASSARNSAAALPGGGGGGCSGGRRWLATAVGGLACRVSTSLGRVRRHVVASEVGGVLISVLRYSRAIACILARIVG